MRSLHAIASAGGEEHEGVRFSDERERLIKHLKPLVCDGQRVHADLATRYPAQPHAKAKDQARMPVELCRPIARGCEEALHAPNSIQKNQRAYVAHPLHVVCCLLGTFRSLAINVFLAVLFESMLSLSNG